MKKIIALLLCGLLLFGAALADEAPAGKTIIVKGEFAITAKLPEGYTLEVTKIKSGAVAGALVSEDETKPEILLGISFSEEFDDRKLNDLSEEEIQDLLAETDELFSNPQHVIQETSHGTKLIGVYEDSAEMDQFDIFTLWNGYFVEVLVIGREGHPLTQDQLKMVNEVISDMWMKADDTPLAEGEDPIVILDEYHGEGAEDSWAK
jgi:hypothetical protein